MIGGGSPGEVFALKLPLTHASTKWSYTRTVRSPRLDPGEVTKVVVVTGQSLGSAWGGGSYTPTNTAKIDQINIEDGGCYAFADPPLGIDSGYSLDPPTTASWMGRFGDYMIDGGVCDRLIIIPCAVGGTEIAKFEPGGVCFERLLMAHRRAQALGLTVDATLVQQGEADNGLGTLQGAYEASSSAMRAGIAVAGFVTKWILAKSTVLDGVSYAPVRAAIDAMVNNANIFAGPDMDSYVGGTYRLADGTHLNATGLDINAGAWKNAVVAAGV